MLYMKKDLIALVVFVVLLGLIAYIFSLQRMTPGTPSMMPTTTIGGQQPIPTPEMGGEPSEITLTAKVNKPAQGLGVTIAPIEVVEDSRCPTGENIRCIQAGTVRVSAKISSGLGTGEVIFKLNTPITTEAGQVELVQVLPPARAEVPIVINEYRFIFKISKRIL